MRAFPMRVSIVVLTVLASSLPGVAQYQGMSAEHCRRISDSQQQLTCLGQIRPPPPGRLGFGPFSPIGLPAVIQPVAQAVNPEPRASDNGTINNHFRPTRKAIASGE
jgi:hypothetical protein